MTSSAIGNTPSINSLVQSLKPGQEIDKKSKEYTKVETAFKKEHPGESFDLAIAKEIMTSRLNGQADKDANVSTLPQMARLNSSNPLTASSPVSFVDKITPPTNAIAPVQSKPILNSGNLKIQGDISLDQKGKKVTGQISSGTATLNLSDPKFQAFAKAPGSSLHGLEFDGKNGYKIAVASGYGLDAHIKIGTENGRLYFKPDGFLAGTFSGTVKQQMQDFVKNTLGIDADFEVERMNQGRNHSETGRIFINPKSYTPPPEITHETKEVDTYDIMSGIKTGTGIEYTGKVFSKPTDIDLGNGTKVSDAKLTLSNPTFDITKDGLKMNLNNATFSGNISGGVANSPLITGGNGHLEASVTTGTSITTDEKPPISVNINVKSATKDFKLENPEQIKGFIKEVQTQLNAGTQASKVITDALKNANIAPDLIGAIISGDDKKIDELVKNSDLVSKLSQASLHADLKNININYQKSGENTSVTASGNNSLVSATASADSTQTVNLASINKLNEDLKDKTKLEKSGLSKEDVNVIAKIKTQSSFDKLMNSELSQKLQTALQNLYGHQEVSATVSATTIDSIMQDGKIKINATGASADGKLKIGDTEVAKFSADAQSLILDIEKGKTSGNATGATVSAKASNVKLSKENIAKLSKMLEEAKVQVVDVLKHAGLTESQFVSIAKAVTNIGKEKGSLETQLKQIAKNSGANEKQIKDLMGLFSESHFKNMLNDFTNISKALNSSAGGKFNFSASGNSKDLKWSSSDDKLLAAANIFALEVKVGTADGNMFAGATITGDSVSRDNNNFQATGIVDAAKIRAGNSKVTASGSIEQILGNNKLTGIQANNPSIQTVTGTGASGGARASQIDIDPTTGATSVIKPSANIKYNDSSISAAASDIKASPKKPIEVNHLHGNVSSTRTQGGSSGHLGVTFNTNQVLFDKEGKIKSEEIRLQLEAKVKSAVANLNIMGAKIDLSKVSVDSKGKTSISGVSVNKANGNLDIDYARLKALIQSNPKGRALIKSIQESGVNIPENQRLSFKMDDAALKNGVLSGKINLPQFDTGLGKANISLNINSANATKQAAKLTGNIKLNLDQDKLVKLLEEKLHLKESLGIDLSAGQNGSIDARRNGFLASGAATVSVHGDQISVTIDEAKLLKFISVKGLATDKAQSAIKAQLGDILSRNGNTINVPIKGITDKFLEMPDLNISGVSHEGNRYSIPFSYQKN